MDKEFSIIIGYRDRDLNRMRRCLNSLAEQQLQNFETIIIDSGSSEYYRNQLKDLISKYNFLKLHYNHTEGLPWNRSHALNVGIRMAGTPYIFSGDMDLLFRSDFSTVMRNYMGSEDAFFFSVFLIDKNFHDWTNFYKYRQFIRSGEKGKGISLIRKSILSDVFGYNEFYSFWGYEDNDLYKKLNKKIKCHFIETDLLYHQYHELSYEEGIHFPVKWRKFMEDHLNYHFEFAIDRQTETWGKKYNTSERPAVNYFQSNINLNEINLKGSSRYIEYLIHSYINNNQKKILKIIYRSNIENYNNSNSAKLIRILNKILGKVESVPFLFSSKYRSSYLSVQEIRDLVIYILYFRRDQISDYYLDMNTDQNIFTAIIVKK